MEKREPNIINFLANPSVVGGKTDMIRYEKKYREYLDRYEKYISKNGSVPFTVYLNAVGSEIKEAYYHMLIHSDGNNDIAYDVIILFYTNDANIATEPSFKRYNIQLFSNSPGFTFQYAYLYNKLKIITEELVYKFSKVVLTNPPNKTNPMMEMGVDSSVFYAVNYLITHPELLNKKAISNVTKSISKFDMTSIPTPEEVVERRSESDTSNIKKLEKTIKSIIKKPKNLIFGSRGRKAKKAQKASQSTTAQVAKKARKSSKPSKAKKPR
jgi:hypothetical protein